MSKVTGRSPCPSCRKDSKDRKGDNLIHYNTGAKHCFSCGYHVHPSGIARVKQHMEQKNEMDRDDSRYILDYPSDATNSIPTEPMKWLYKYGVTTLDIVDNKIQWSDHLNITGKSMLLFPVYIANEMVMWQGRFFPKDEKRKYFTKGPVEDILYILHNTSGNDTIIIVEDIISAIKVRKVCDTMPLFGSHFSFRKMQAIAKRYAKAILWLDPDKVKEAIKMKSEYQGFFEKGVNVILSKTDPKECMRAEIESSINMYRS